VGELEEGSGGKKKEGGIEKYKRDRTGERRRRRESEN
jgi:hypothetical protein